MALIFILHVLGIGIVLSRIPFRLLTVVACLVYFVSFYLLCGHYLASHREALIPKMPLEDDYYNFRPTKKKSPFDSPEPAETLKEEEETTLELERKARLKEELDQTKTKP